MGDPAFRADTDDKVTLRGGRDFALYYGPASVPFLAALLLGLDFLALTWLIWLELLPRGILLSLEVLADRDYRKRSIAYRGVTLLILLGACAGAMAFVVMFFPPLRASFETLFQEALAAGPGPALAAFFEELGRLGVLGPFAVATAARAFRAWWIDVHQDPAMAHVRHDTKERRTRRMFAFVALILWIAGLSSLSVLASFGERFFASLAAGIYCFLPLVAQWANELRRRLAPHFRPA